MRISLPCIIFFRFCKINDLFSLLLATSHIYVAIFFQAEMHLTKFLVPVFFFCRLLFKLLLKTAELI